MSITTVSKVSYLVCVFTTLFDPSKYQDPLYFIFDYVAGVSDEECSDALMYGNLDLIASAGMRHDSCS